MSVKAKGTSKTKILEHFAKMDLDEKMDVFSEMKELLHKQVLEKVNRLTGFAEKHTSYPIMEKENMK